MKELDIRNIEGAAYGQILSPQYNVNLHFGGYGRQDFIIQYYRKRPLNKFQIWMYKICFGITAENI